MTPILLFLGVPLLAITLGFLRHVWKYGVHGPSTAPRHKRLEVSR